MVKLYMVIKCICLHAKAVFAIGDGNCARGVGSTVEATTHVGFLPVACEASRLCAVRRSISRRGSLLHLQDASLLVEPTKYSAWSYLRSHRLRLMGQFRTNRKMAESAEAIIWRRALPPCLGHF